MNLENKSNPNGMDLSRSALTPNQAMDLVHRYRKVQKDTFRWYVDWSLMDAFIEIWEKRSGSEDLISELRKSALDKNLSKQFYNNEATMENLRHFLDDGFERPSFTWNQNFKVAATLLRKMIQVTKLQPATVESISDLENIWSNKSASAGAIGRGSKEVNEVECFEAVKRLESLIEQGVGFDDIWIPCTPGHRSQISNLVSEGSYSYEAKFKDRLIWIVDGGTVSLEAKYASVLIPYLVDNWYGYSGGDSSDTLRRKIRSIGKDKSFISIDYSKFDQTVQSWLIAFVFDIIKDFFDAKYHKELDWIKYNFINTRIIQPGVGIIQKHRGIPSGSNFTQIVGSMCNTLMMLTYISSRCRSTDPKDKLRYVEQELAGMYDTTGKLGMFVMGDDNLSFTRTRIDLDSLSKYVWRFFGVEVNVNKSTSSVVSKFPEYLKREWRGRGEYRNVLDMAINMIHPERNRDYKTYTPWHIMYGIYLTYSESFPTWVTERFFVHKMDENGGLELLLEVNPKDLPGSLRKFGYTARTLMYHRANAILGK